MITYSLYKELRKLSHTDIICLQGSIISLKDIELSHTLDIYQADTTYSHRLDNAIIKHNNMHICNTINLLSPTYTKDITPKCQYKFKININPIQNNQSWFVYYTKGYTSGYQIIISENTIVSCYGLNPENINISFNVIKLIYIKNIKKIWIPIKHNSILFQYYYLKIETDDGVLEKNYMTSSYESAVTIMTIIWYISRYIYQNYIIIMHHSNTNITDITTDIINPTNAYMMSRSVIPSNCIYNKLNSNILSVQTKENITENELNAPIEKIIVCRQPLSAFITNAAYYLTFGTFDKAVKEMGYDKMYHSYCIVETATHKYIIEKNDGVILSRKIPDLYGADSIANNRSIYELNICEGDYLSLKIMLNNTYNLLGHEFNIYNARTSNCQNYIYAMINANQLMETNLIDFIQQDASKLFEILPRYVSFASNMFEGIIGGVAGRFISSG